MRSWLVAVGLWAVLAVHALADPRPPDHVWGVVGMLALRPATRWILLALAAMLALPPVARALVRRCRPAAARVAASFARVPTWLWIALLVALAWLLRSRMLYGDAEILTACINRGQWTYYKEPLGFLAIALVYRAANAVAGVDAATAIALVNTLAGALYWAGVARLARFRPLGDGRGWAVWLLLGTAGTVGTYFGLIEKRGLLVAGTLWTLVLLLEAVADQRRSLALSAGVLGLTLATHLAVAWIAPAAPVAWYLRNRERLRRSAPREERRAAWREAFRCTWLALLPFVVVAAGMAVAGMKLSGFSAATMGGGDGKVFVPLFQVETAYERFTMFSLDHLVAFSNELLLLAPVAIVLAFVLPLVARRDAERADAGIPVLLAATLGALLFAFTFNPDMMVSDPRLGALNEWDLFGFAGVPLTLLGLWALRTAVPPGEERDALCLSACAVAVLHGLPWFLFNAGIRL